MQYFQDEKLTYCMILDHEIFDLIRLEKCPPQPFTFFIFLFSLFHPEIFSTVYV